MAAQQDVFAAALALPASERSELAHRLIACLEAPADVTAVTEEWAAEIEQRLAGIESGATTGITRAAVHEELKP